MFYKILVAFHLDLQMTQNESDETIFTIKYASEDQNKV